MLWYPWTRMCQDPELFDERDMTVIISFLNSTIQSLEASDFWIIQNLGPEFRVIFKLMLYVM